MNNSKKLNNYKLISINNGTLINTDTLTNKHNLYIGRSQDHVATLRNEHDLNNDGLIEISSRSTLNNIKTLTNNKVLANDGTILNTGKINNNSIFSNTGTFISYEDSHVSGNGAYTQTAGTSTINGFMSQAKVTINGGKLKGSGSIDSNVIFNGTDALNLATIAPGNSIDTLTINGDYTQGEFGLMAIEFNETDIDLLDISGTATLDGILELIFTGADITEGTFNFLSFASHIGSFDSIIAPSIEGFNFDIALDDTSANLVISQKTISSVPTPGAVFFFGPALLGLIGFRQRNCRQAQASK